MTERHPTTFVAKGDCEIVMTREFDAPRDLVWDAFTRPELLKRWYGPPGWTLTTCEIDLRRGGKYRFEMRNASSGDVMGWGGEYLDVDRPQRFVQTEIPDQAWYEGGAQHTNVLTPRPGGTTFQTTFLYTTTATRDMMLGSGMDQGYRTSFEKLDAELSSQTSSPSEHQQTEVSNV